jgi:hypothetical protein
MAFGAGQMVFGVLGRAADVDALRKLGEPFDAHPVVVATRTGVDHRRELKSGSNAGHTLSRSNGCAAAVG